MTRSFTTPGLLSILGFAVFVILSSLDVLKKYAGSWGMLAYSLFVLAIFIAGHRLGWQRINSAIPERWAVMLAVGTLLGVIVVTALIYPIANAGTYGGGSDADDALIIAARELAAGRYPFYPLTYLGNPIAPLPGSVILALPFVILGILPMQNVFWLAVFFLIVRDHLKSSSYALILTWLLLALSPAIFQNLVTATDRTSNAIFILSAIWWMLRTIPRPAVPAWQKVLPAILLGIGLSSRTNFLFLTPLVFSAILQNTDWKTAVKCCGIVGTAFLLVTVPFWIYDPAGFTPFTVQSYKMSQFESTVPYARILVPVTGMILAGALAFRRMDLDLIELFWGCAVVQLYSVLLLSAISTLHNGYLDLYLGHVSYGVFFLFFAGFAAWIGIRNRDPAIQS